MKTKFTQYYESLETSEKRHLRREICYLCGMSESSFSNKKNGRSEFSKLEKEAICEHLNNDTETPDFEPDTLFEAIETENNHNE